MQWRGDDPTMQGVLVRCRVAAGVWTLQTRLCGCTTRYTGTIGEIAPCGRSLGRSEGVAHELYAVLQLSQRRCRQGTARKGRRAAARSSVAVRRAQAGRARREKFGRGEAMNTTSTAVRAQPSRIAQGVGVACQRESWVCADGTVERRVEATAAAGVTRCPSAAESRERRRAEGSREGDGRVRRAKSVSRVSMSGHGGATTRGDGGFAGAGSGGGSGAGAVRCGAGAVREAGRKRVEDQARSGPVAASLAPGEGAQAPAAMCQGRQR
jgi:hypothetical protein